MDERLEAKLRQKAEELLVGKALAKVLDRLDEGKLRSAQAFLYGYVNGSVEACRMSEAEAKRHIADIEISDSDRIEFHQDSPLQPGQSKHLN